MALSQVMRKLLERAEQSGKVETKRVRQASVMGSYENEGMRFMTTSERTEYIKNSPLVSQWSVLVTYTENNRYKNIFVDHYGTQILHLVLENGCLSSMDWYGQSNTDRDTLNGLMEYFDIPHRFTYRPKNGGFQIHKLEVSK